MTAPWIWGRRAHLREHRRQPRHRPDWSTKTAAARGISREEALDAQGWRVTLGRFAEPEEIASVVTFLCSQRASDVVGAAWSVDGGSSP